MGLRETAHADLIEIMNDSESGTVAISIISPASVSENFQAFSNDIHITFDPDTGMAVTGRQCTVAVLISELITAGFWNNTDRADDIRGEPDKAKKPWVVTTTDVNGITGTFKVIETLPDNGAGLMPIMLEVYTPL